MAAPAASRATADRHIAAMPVPELASLPSAPSAPLVPLEPLEPAAPGAPSAPSAPCGPFGAVGRMRKWGWARAIRRGGRVGWSGCLECGKECGPNKK